MNKQKHKGIQASRLLATLNNESTNRLQTKDKVRSHHLIHSLLDQILCDFNLFLIPSYTYSSFSQCNTLWRMLGYQLQKNSNLLGKKGYVVVVVGFLQQLLHF